MNEVRITRSARKHRIGVAHIRFALTNAVLVDVDGDMALYIGTDDRGIELELGIVADDKRENAFALVHCMPTEFRKK